MFIVSSIVFSLIGPGFSTYQAYAAAMPVPISGSSNGTSQTVTPSPQDLSQLDQYVSVINNRYVLNVPARVFIDQNTLAKAQEAISESNKNITQNDLIINPISKTATRIAGGEEISPIK